MLLDDEDIGHMIEAIGDGEVALFGTETLPVDFNPDGVSRLDGDEVVRTGPYALASAAAVAALGIAAGNDGDTLTLRGIEYTVLAIDPDGMGMVALSLEEC
jgi:hypothetical protein